jgi:hypothetical protein
MRCDEVQGPLRGGGGVIGVEEEVSGQGSGETADGEVFLHCL